MVRWFIDALGVRVCKIEFDAVSGGVRQEDLYQTRAGRLRDTVRYATLTKHRFDIGSVRAIERDVIERARDVCVTHLTRIGFPEMHNGPIAGIEPVAEISKRRPRPNVQPDDAAIEVLQRIE